MELKFVDIPIDLSSDELRRVYDAPGMGEFQRQKLEKDAKKNWDLFYKRNGDRFFKTRYWTRREFSELYECSDTKKQIRLLEVGCGCGDFVMPLLEQSDDSGPSDCKPSRREVLIYCCDISDRAIEILKSNPIYKANSPLKIKAFSCDITIDRICDKILNTELDGIQMDIVSLIFVLSAIDPLKLEIAIKNISRVLKPGGLVLFRDYAMCDKAMLRFNEKSKICDQFYVRQDGTRAYFFTKEQVIASFEEQNFKIQSIDYVKRDTINNATKEEFTRIFLQAKITKNT